MAHRSFTDAHGTEWQVWDVIPARAERRGGQRRSAGAGPMVERRRVLERRRGDDGEIRVRVPAGLERGWLAFESAHERRRLVPIPPGWDGASPATLCVMAERATPLPSRRPRLIE